MFRRDWGPGCGMGPHGFGMHWHGGHGRDSWRRPGRRHGPRDEVEELENYLRDLEDEAAAVKEELEELRARRAPGQTQEAAQA